MSETKFQVGSLSENNPNDPIFNNFADALAEAERQVSLSSKIDNGLWAAVWVLPGEDFLPWIAVVVNSPISHGDPILFWSEHEDVEELKEQATHSGVVYLVRMGGESVATWISALGKAKNYAEVAVRKSQTHAVIYRKDLATGHTSTECVVMHREVDLGTLAYYQGEKVIEVG